MFDVAPFPSVASISMIRGSFPNYLDLDISHVPILPALRSLPMLFLVLFGSCVDFVDHSHFHLLESMLFPLSVATLHSILLVSPLPWVPFPWILLLFLVYRLQTSKAVLAAAVSHSVVAVLFHSASLLSYHLINSDFPLSWRSELHHR